MKIRKALLSFCLVIMVLLFNIEPALAFCGFYVAKADSSLYNQASSVIIAKDGERTVLTMANDYQGEAKDFAMVVPVPVILKREQVNVGQGKIIERLDGFSAPRLVEYFDEDPCQIAVMEDLSVVQSRASNAPRSAVRKEKLGVTIEEEFTVGEYDIVILSAKESDGLETWLTQNGYKIPQGTKELLQPYIRQNLKFFVAKVNLEEFDKQGFQKLRPISMAYESPKFMLPIRLGMTNAKNEQDLIVYLLSPKGQVQLTNYRTVKIPSNIDVPEFVQKEFKDFYISMFQKSYEKENKNVAFLEYAWDMGSCDPCSAQPLNREELKQAGVFWLNDTNPSNINPRRNPRLNNVFITRLHVRYTRDKFPEDLRFQETGNKELFQGRYVIRHPFRGQSNYEKERDCKSRIKEYQKNTKNRQEKEGQTLASLTGWDIQDIRSKIDFIDVDPSSLPWWRTLW